MRVAHSGDGSRRFANATGPFGAAVSFGVGLAGAQGPDLGPAGEGRRDQPDDERADRDGQEGEPGDEGEERDRDEGDQSIDEPVDHERARWSGWEALGLGEDLVHPGPPGGVPGECRSTVASPGMGWSLAEADTRVKELGGSRLDSGAVSAEPVAIDGRALGRRGVRTRGRLLDATAELLETRGVRDLRVVDIARQVETSPATFYQYFHDVEDAVLALAAAVGEDLAPIEGLLARDWSGPDGFATARDLVQAFMEYWDAHRAILRTRNLAAQEGDRRFRAVRNDALRPLREGLAAKVVEAQARGAVSGALSPVAAASALSSMLERMAAFHADLVAFGASRDDVVETTARIVYQTVTGAGA